MLTFAIRFDLCPDELRDGLAAIAQEMPDRLSGGVTAILVTFQAEPYQESHGWRAQWAPGAVEVTYGQRIDAFRALGHLLGRHEVGTDIAVETSPFDLLGVMVDVSRNAVLTPESVKLLIRRCALLGLNTLMLYAEDTYEVPGEPFFGYLRGRYTHDDLRTLDDYAALFGIEMIPCIQTLGHLEQILQWPAYAAVRDTAEILLADEDKSYALIEKMLTAASAPVRSRRIHIGMDEAVGLGSGRYKERGGEAPPFDILTRHLARVKALCEKLGLRPMIWSDMFFRLASPTRDYYGEITVPSEVIAQIPSGLDLVYWDYYHTDVADYSRAIARHRALGRDPLVAGGGWTWDRLWAALPYAFTATNACMEASKQAGIRQAFITLWGDDGAECDIFAALPVLALLAEHAYVDRLDVEHLKAQYRGACGADMEDWFTASELDYFSFLTNGTQTPTNVSKWLLWQDPLLPVTDPNLLDLDLRNYYSQLATRLASAAAKPGLAQRLRMPAALAHVLSLKCHLHRDLAYAYQMGDWTRLCEIAEHDLPALRAAVDTLWRTHRDLWLSTNKPFGLEVLEMRYGGLRTRLESLADRLVQYLEGEIPAIPELDETLLKYADAPVDSFGASRARVQTPSCIK
jgi:hexosaminidase